MASTKSLNRKITRELTVLENQLKNKLVSFYNKKVKPLAISTAPETIRQKYEQEIKNLIRRTVEASALIGIGIVGSQIKLKIPEFQVFISVNDIQNIQSVTNKVNDAFWKTVSRLVIRETTSKMIDGELQPLNPFDTKAAMIGASAYVVYSAFNSAVQTKTTTLSALPLAPSTIDLEIQFDVQRLGGKVRFTTAQDARVDPEICQPLEGNIYDSFDPSLPVPPLHANCRCRLIPIIEGEI